MSGLNSIIRSQQKVINDMKIYELGLEEMMRGLGARLARMLEERPNFRKN